MDTMSLGTRKKDNTILVKSMKRFVLVSSLALVFSWLVTGTYIYFVDFSLGPLVVFKIAVAFMFSGISAASTREVCRRIIDLNKIKSNVGK